jgi:hypothetical protein
MRAGIIFLYCPICGNRFNWNQNKLTSTYRHRDFGVICSKSCFDAAEKKYAMLILGKDEPQCDYERTLLK